MDESPFVKSLRTGDLVFFDSVSVVAFFIRLSDFCLWNHVGMIVRFPTETSPAYLWEATDSVLPPNYPSKHYFDPHKRTGVLLTQFQSRLDCFYGTRSNPAPTHEYTNFLRPQENVFGISRISCSEESREAIRRFVERENEKTYEETWFPVFKSWWDGWNTCLPCCVGTMNEEDVSRYFCSELIAETLLQSGILRKRMLWCSRRGFREEPSSEFTVFDLQNTEKMNERTKFDFHFLKVEKFCL